MQPLHTPRGTNADFISGNYSNKHFVFELIKKNPEGGAYRSAETGASVKYPLSSPFPLTGTIFCKDKEGRNYPRKIRFAEGEQSIFVDEQQPDDKVKKKTVYANFVKGRFQVEGNNSTLLKFMMAWDMNESKIDRDPKKSPLFRLVDTTKINTKAREDKKLQFDVINWCYTASWKDKIEPLASLLFTYEQMLQNAEDIRHNLAVMAEREPIAFKKMLDDPEMERMIIVKSAIKSEIVVVNTGMNSLCWSDNSNLPISVAAPGKDVVKDFVSKSFTTQGEKYYLEIKRLLTPEEEEIVVAETKQFPVAFDSPMLTSKGSQETTEELTTLVRLGVEKGLITVSKTRVWWKFMGESFSKEEGMVKGLRDNSVMLTSLKNKVLEEVPDTV